MESVTEFDLLAAGVVILAVLAAWNTVWTSIKNYREAKRPRDDEKARLDALEKHVDNDNRRLNELEESNRLMLRAISQLIEHEVTGNHDGELRKVQQDINTYLINR